MYRGYIRLWRNLEDEFFYKDAEHVLVWIHLLLNANYKDNEVLFNGEQIIVKRGQLITGRKALNKSTGINEYKIMRILNTLETAHLIAQQKNNRFTLITVLKYEKYQDDNAHQVAQQLHNSCTHSNKDNKEKNKDFTQSNNTVTVRKN